MSELRASDPRVPDALAGFLGGLRWSDAAGPGADGDVAPPYRACLACFHAAQHGPWRPACSLWGQVYFNTLLIPATWRLATGWREDVVARGVAPLYCGQTGVPLGFSVFGEACAPGAAGAEAALLEVVETHIGEMIAKLATAGGLSTRMLWEGAERTLQWAAAQIAADAPACSRRLQAVAEGAGGRSRVARAWIAPAPASGVRRFCCLRYQLGAGSACADICPRRLRASQFWDCKGQSLG